jgi:hypothetical protein
MNTIRLFPRQKYLLMKRLCLIVTVLRVILRHQSKKYND